jgi:AcrR family transcriptional regulator
MFVLLAWHRRVGLSRTIILFYRGPVPKVTEEYRTAKRQEIADAALRAFRRKGFQGASMADIIAESGLSAGAIYGHYASKAEIVVDVASRVINARVGEAQRLFLSDPLPPPSRLVRVLMTGMLDDVGDPTILVQLWGEAATDPALRSMSLAVFGRLRETYEQYISLWHQREHGVSPKDGAAIAADQVPIFLSAAQGFIVQTALMPGFDREHYLESLDRLLPR